MPPFDIHLDVIGLAAAGVVLYEYGIRRLAPSYCPADEAPTTARKRLAFHSGLALMVVASSWPIHELGEQRLYLIHMVEHMTLSLIVPPLLLGGMPWWLTRVVVRPVLPAVRFLTKPLVALVLFNGWLALTHVPAVVELMLTNELFHLVSHAGLFITAILMWWPVMDPIPDTQTLTPFGKMGYLFLQSLVPTIPASFLTLGSSPLYPIYETFPRTWGLSPMNDQVLGGLLMKIGGGLIIWGFIAWVFFSWWAEEQRYATPPVVVRTRPPES